MMRQRLHELLLVVFAVTGAVVVLLHNVTWGVGLHWDAINYISVADSLLAGEGFVPFSGYAYTWPPLYPALLAATGFLSGFDPHAASGPLNALLFGLTVLVAGHWLRQRITSRPLALWGCLAVTFALPLTSLASWAMSETAFILFVTLTLFHIDRFLRDGQRDALIWAALFTALACLTRYIGFALVILLPLLLLCSNMTLREKIKRGAVFVLISVMPVSLWLLSNMARAGTPAGQLTLLEGNTLHRFVNVALAELTEWILPRLPVDYVPLDEGQWRVAMLIAAALFALTVAIGFALIRTYGKPGVRRKWIFFCLCGGFALIYLISLYIIQKFAGVGIGWGNRRYWSPLYIPLLFALVFAMDRLLIWLRKPPVQLPVIRTFARAGVILGILLFIWLGNNVRLTIQNIARAHEGLGMMKVYAAPEWANDDVIRFIREAQVEGTIFGNKLANLYIHGNPVNDVRFPPHRLEDLKRTVEKAVEGDYLVWFNDSIPITVGLADYHYGLPELEAMSGLEPVAYLDTGVIFRVIKGK